MITLCTTIELTASAIGLGVTPVKVVVVSPPVYVYVVPLITTVFSPVVVLNPACAKFVVPVFVIVFAVALNSVVIPPLQEKMFDVPLTNIILSLASVDEYHLSKTYLLCVLDINICTQALLKSTFIVQPFVVVPLTEIVYVAPHEVFHIKADVAGA